MKRFSLVLLVFVALGCIVAPSAVVSQTNGNCPSPTKPKPAAGTPAPEHKSATKPAAGTPADQGTKNNDSSLLAGLLVQLNEANAISNRQTSDAFLLGQQALKLREETDARRIAIEQQDANTRQYIAEKGYELDARRVTVEELDQKARAPYYAAMGKASLLDAKAHMVDATLGNFLKAGGEVGSAFLTGPMKVTATGGNSTSSAVGEGGKGGNASASAATSK